MGWPQERGTDQLGTTGLSSFLATNVARNIWLPTNWGVTKTPHSPIPAAYTHLGQLLLPWERSQNITNCEGTRSEEERGHRDEETLLAHMREKLSVLCVELDLSWAE